MRRSLHGLCTLIQVTLLKVSNPVVSRTLSIPASVTFFDLHHAIEAGFGWDGDDTTADYGDKPFPLVKVVKGNPFRAEEYDLMPALFSTQLGDEVDGIPGVECDDLEYANVHRILNDFRVREHYLIYDYHICGVNRYPHVIQRLGRMPDDYGNRITCVAGQGYTTLKAWSKRDYSAGKRSVSKGGPKLMGIRCRKSPRPS
ncbi:hypothetical protein OEA41_006426 [Lepraria neglecta]|uniref:Uncharacterized protein n=1 Tax=Lepraria neglecta TaxID=209136 RepID=A0AAE0DK76_9LECA|nr:hypothetical protein OEA41_006426 [Lepraria neglecta]